MVELETLGRFKIISELGRGGMGIVLKGKDPRIDRMVAIKIIRRETLGDAQQSSELLDRFYIEAKAAGKLTHPRIVTIYEAGETDDMSFIVMEYVNGDDLSNIIGKAGQLPYKRVIKQMLQIADGLGYAHESDIIHRDVKPGNILVQKGDNIKITDFGLARLQSTGSVTQTGHAVGSPIYMSPEQVQGQYVDSRSDIFSLGAMMYEMLTGIRPFEGDSITGTIFKIIMDEPSPPSKLVPGIPNSVDRVVMKLLEKEPEKRYQTCKELIADLEKLDSAKSNFIDLTKSDSTKTTDFLHGGIPDIENDDETEYMPEPRRSSRGIGVFAGFMVVLALAGMWWYINDKEVNLADTFILPDTDEVVATPTEIQEEAIAEPEDTTRTIGKVKEPVETVSSAKPPKDKVPTAVAEVEKSVFSIASSVGGEVFVDGVSIGKSPLDDYSIDAGNHEIEVVALYHEPWKKSVTVKPGERLDMSADLKLAGGAVVIESDPEGSTVYLDGKEIGVTPMIVGDLVEGEHEFAVESEGFTRFSKKISITNKKPEKLIAKLKRPPGRLSIISVSGAEISVNGEPVGLAPKALKLAKGTYTVEVTKSGYEPYKKSIAIEYGEKASINANLVKMNVGSLRIIAIPWADIYVNGKKIGTTPKVIDNVQAGDVTIKLLNPGYSPWHKIIKLERGQRLTVSHAFERSEARQDDNQAQEPIIDDNAVGSLKVTSRIEGYVFVDGNPVGKTPVVLTNIQTGAHTVVLKRRGMPDYNREINVVDGIVTRLVIE